MSNDYIFSQILKIVDQNPHKKWGLKEMAYHFNYSPYHFHRLFKKVSGETFQQFVMRRRLSYAAIELMNENQQILDTALRYEYRSHEAFSRAFKNYFNLTPSAFRTRQLAFPFFKQNFLFSAHTKVHTPKVKVMPRFTHAGLKTTSHQIREVWGRLIEKVDVSEHDFLVGVIDHHIGKYIAGFFQNDKVLSKAFTMTNIPSSLYVTTYHHGSYETVIETYRYIYAKWLPKSPYIYDANRPQIEIYRQNKRLKVCIPIKEVRRDEINYNRKD